MQRERAIETQLNTLAAAGCSCEPRAHAEAVASLDKDIARLEQERERLEIEVRRSSPRYAALAHPQRLVTGDIEQRPAGCRDASGRVPAR